MAAELVTEKQYDKLMTTIFPDALIIPAYTSDMRKSVQNIFKLATKTQTKIVQIKEIDPDVMYSTEIGLTDLYYAIDDLFNEMIGTMLGMSVHDVLEIKCRMGLRPLQPPVFGNNSRGSEGAQPPQCVAYTHCLKSIDNVFGTTLFDFAVRVGEIPQ